MNYFIEGIQGAGKSTLVNRLAEKLPQYQVFREGDYLPGAGSDTAIETI